MNMHDYLEKLAIRYSSGNFSESIQKAKLRFQSRAGIKLDVDNDFEFTARLFIDWYVFSYKLPDIGLTPAEHNFRELSDDAPEEEALAAGSLLQIRHSLFVMIKEKKGIYAFRDLMDGKRFAVDSASSPVGFREENIYELRLMPMGDDLYGACPGIVEHPEAAKKSIERLIKRFRSMQSQMHESGREDVREQAASLSQSDIPSNKESFLLELGQRRNFLENNKNEDISYIYERTVSPKMTKFQRLFRSVQL